MQGLRDATVRKKNVNPLENLKTLAPIRMGSSVSDTI